MYVLRQVLQTLKRRKLYLRFEQNRRRLVPQSKNSQNY